jgi:hypothetical protein
MLSTEFTIVPTSGQKKSRGDKIKRIYRCAVTASRIIFETGSKRRLALYKGNPVSDKETTKSESEKSMEEEVLESCQNALEEAISSAFTCANF